MRRPRARSPEQQAAVADWAGHVQILVDALPEDLRHPVLLSAIKKMTSHQIGIVLGIPGGTVRNRISRARQILKQKTAALLEKPHGK